MSTEIDKRVVEMQFDNKQFERNVQTSLSTLDKLKMALNFDGAKGLDSITKAANKLDLSNINKQTDQIKLSFSALEVAGMTVVQELTKSFMNFGKNIWNMSFGQIKSGGMGRALKIEQANFKMQALAKNLDAVKQGTITVTELMEKMGDAIDRSVTGTAYGYDAAANVASQLMASGITNADKMYDYLRGIAGAAAMTGRSFEDIGNIFTTIASNGKLMTMQLRQFSASGLNVAATLTQTSKFAGQTEASIADMISKGKIGFEDFADAMNEAFGEAAGKADETYAGVLSNVKAQLSRLGQRFAVPYIENMIPFLQQLKATIKEISAKLQPIATRFDQIFGKITRYGSKILENFNIPRYTAIFRGIENLIWGVVIVLRTLHDAFVEVFPPQTTDDIVNAAMEFERFTEQLLPTKDAVDGLRGIFVALLAPFRIVLKAFSSLTKYTRPIIVAILRVVYAITSVFQVLEPIVMQFLNFIEQLGIFEAILETVTKAVVYFIVIAEALIVVLVDLVKKIAESERLRNMAGFVMDIANAISEYLIRVLIFLLEIVDGVIEKFQSAGSGTSFFDQIANNAIQLWGLLKQLAGAFEIWFNTYDSAAGLKSIINFFRELGGLIKDFFTGGDITDNAEGMANAINTLGDALKNMGEKFRAAWENIDKGEVIMIAFAVTIIAVMLALKNLIDTTSGFVGKMTNIPAILTDIRGAIQNIGNFSGPAQAILAFAGAVAVVTNAIVTLSKIPVEELKNATIALGSIAGALLIFTLAMTVFTKRIKKGEEEIIDKSALNLIAITGSIVALSLSIKMLAELESDTKKILASVGVIVVIMGALIGAMYLLTKFVPEIAGGSIAFITFSASIMILVKAIQLIDAVPMDHMIETMSTLSTLIIAFGFAIGLAGKASGWAALTISAFTGSVLVLFGMFMILAFIPMEVISNAIAKATEIFSMFIPLIMTIGLASRLAGNGTKLGGTLWALILGLTSFLGMFVIFAKLTDGLDLRDSLGTIAIITIVITLFLVAIMGVEAVISHFAGKSRETLRNARQSDNTFKALTSLMFGLAAVVLAMGIAAKLMEKTGSEQLITLVGIVAIIGVVLIAVTALSGANAVPKNSAANIFSMVALISAMSLIIAALIGLQFADPDKLVIAGAVLSETMLALGILLVATKFIPQLAKTKRGLNSLLVNLGFLILSIGGVVAAFGIVLKYIETVPESMLKTFGLVFGGLIAVMAIIIGKFSSIPSANYKNALEGIGSMALLMPMIAVLAGTMYLLAKMPAGVGKRVALYMGLMGVAISAIGAIMLLMTRIVEKHNIHTSDMIAIALVLDAACLSLAEIAASMIIMRQAFKDAKPSEMVGMIAAMGILFAELSVALGVLVYMTSKFRGTDFAWVAGSMVAVGLAFVELGSAFAIMKRSGATPDEIKGYATALGILFAAIFTAGMIVSFFTPMIAGFAALAVAMIGFGIMAKSVGQGVLFLAQAVQILAKTTTEDVNNAIDAIIAALGRARDIKIALTKALPDIVETVSMVLRYLGELIGTFIGNVAAMGVIIFARVIAENLEVILQSVALILGVVVKWLEDPSTQKLIEHAFAAIAQTALSALAGLFKGIEGIQEVLKELEGWSLRETAEQLWNDFFGITDFDSWNDLNEKVNAQLIKYFEIPVDEITEEQKAAMESLMKLQEQLMIKGVGNQYYIKPYEILESQNKKVNLGLLRYYENIYKTLDYNDEKFEQYLNKMEEYGIQYDKFIYGIDDNPIEAVRAISFQGDPYAKIVYDMIDDFKRVREAAHDESEALERYASDIEAHENVHGQYLSSIAAETTEMMVKTSSDTRKFTENMQKMEDTMDQMSNRQIDPVIEYYRNIKEESEAAGGGVLSLHQKLQAPIRPRVDAVALQGLNTNLNLIDKGFNKISTKATQLREDVAPVANQIGEQGEASADTAQAVESLDQASENASFSISDMGNSLMDYIGKAWQASKATGSLGDKIKDVFNIDIHGWLTDMTGLGDMFKTAEDWRKEGSELIRMNGMPSNVPGIERWKTYVDENGKRMYSSLEDYVNAQSSSGKNAYESIWNPKSMDEILEEAKEKADSMSGGLTSGLSETEDAAKKAKDRLEDLRNTVSGCLDIFTEFNKETELTGKEVLRTFLGQLDGVTEWTEMMAGLSEKGVAQPIISMLEEEGPRSYEKVNAIYKMTSKEIALLNAMSLDANTMASKSIETIEKSITDRLKRGSDQVSLWPDTVEEFEAAAMASGAQLAEGVAEGFIGSAAIQSAGGEMVEYLADDTIKHIPEFQSAFEWLGKSAIEALRKELAFEDAIKSVTAFRDELSKTISSAMNIFDEVKDEEEISANQMIMNMTEQVKKVGRWATNLSTLASRGMSEGLLNQLKDLGPAGAAKVEAFVKMSAAQLQKANSLYSSSTKVGDYAADKLVSSYAKAGYQASLGFAEGVDPEAAADIMYQLGTKSLTSLQESLDIHSPSRKTYEVGVNTILGLANGMQDPAAITELQNSIAMMGMTVNDAYNNALNGNTLKDKLYKVGMSLDSSEAYQPVIRPVWDMNAVNEGLFEINSYLKNRPFNISASIDKANAARTSISQDTIYITNAIKEVGHKMDRIQDEVASVRAAQANTQAAIRSMDIRLDSGALVGGIITQVDAALGRKVVQQKRRKG